MRARVSLTIEKSLTEEARDMNLNMSRIAETAIAAAIKAERNRLWLAENRAALAASDEYVAKNGLPLEDLRLF